MFPPPHRDATITYCLSDTGWQTNVLAKFATYWCISKSSRTRVSSFPMTKRTTTTAIAAPLLLVTIALLAYERWHRNEISDRDAMLAAMPSTASTIFFADLAELRQSPFVARLYAWAPKPQSIRNTRNSSAIPASTMNAISTASPLLRSTPRRNPDFSPSPTDALTAKKSSSTRHSPVPTKSRLDTKFTPFRSVRRPHPPAPTTTPPRQTTPVPEKFPSHF